MTWTLILLAVGLWLSSIGMRVLFNPDEGRYAEIPREMVESGDWVTPRLNAIKYFEKPPLQYWATASAYKAFGLNEWTVRLWPALMALFAVALVRLAGTPLFGNEQSWYAAMVLVGSPYFVAFSHIATLDMGVTAFLTLTLVAFLRNRSAPHGSKASHRWLITMWIAIGLAVLSKGLIGIVLPLAALGAYIAASGDTSSAKALRPLLGGVVVSAIVAPWFILVSMRNPEFPAFFFIHEHVDRFTSTEHRRTGPVWYYLPILTVAIFPWLVVFGTAVRDAWHNRTIEGFKPQLFLVAWIVSVTAFFSASGSKLPAYVLPVMPAAALLIGERVAALSPGTTRNSIGVLAVTGAIGLFCVVEVVEWMNEQTSVFDLYERWSDWAEPASAVLLVGGLLMSWRRHSAACTMLGAALCGLVASHLLVAGATELAPLHSAHALAQRMKPYLSPETRLFSVGMYEQTLPPYLGSTMTLVAHSDEMAFGLKQEPWRWLPKLDQFADAWRVAPDAMAVMRPSTHNELKRRGLEMTMLVELPNRVAVRKPTAMTPE